MKKTKAQKGITLIALIITVVLLMILAVVAISSIQNDGIISYANNAVKDYEQAQKNEQDILDGYLSYMPGNGGSGGETIGDATVGTKVTNLSTINGQEYGANNPVIPAAFKAIDTATSSWDAEDLSAEVKKGLVISDGTNEFVWIPVADINDMVNLVAEGGTDANGRTNYQGKLYDFSGTTATEISNYGQGTTNCREPANLSNYDNTTNLSTWTETLYQESFNKMVESVAEYKGFYVGRYEMSINATSGKAESVAGATSVYNDSEENNWFGLYEKATTYSTSGVISEMIWGCQYAAMMRWMQSNNIDVSSSTPIDTSRGVEASYNTTRVTGSANSNDILNNVYDILGNSCEWTQQAREDCRECFSGCIESAYYPSGDSMMVPTVTCDKWSSLGTRLTLYVEM